MRANPPPYGVRRMVTANDQRRLKYLLTMAGQNNQKMSIRRIAEYLNHTRHDIGMPTGSWEDFIRAVLTNPPNTYDAVTLEAFIGVVFRETLGIPQKESNNG